MRQKMTLQQVDDAYQNGRRNFNGVEIPASVEPVTDLILDGVSLRNAQLCGVQLTNARLEDVDFTDTNLADVDLSHATCDGADFTRANLTRARLVGTHLLRTTLCGAIIDGAVVASEDIGGPGHIMCALTPLEWGTIQRIRCPIRTDHPLPQKNAGNWYRTVFRWLFACKRP